MIWELDGVIRLNVNLKIQCHFGSKLIQLKAMSS